MRKNYKKIAEKIIAESKFEIDIPEKDASLEKWAAFVAFALKKYDEMTKEEKSKDVKEEYLILALVTELFYTFEERGLNKIIDAITNQKDRKERTNFDYDLTYEQAEILGRIISQRFSKKSKEYLIEELIKTKNTKKPPLSPYKKPNLKKCPICNSINFKPLQKAFLGNELVSKRVCQSCGYTHKITKRDIKPKLIGEPKAS